MKMTEASFLNKKNKLEHFIDLYLESADQLDGLKFPLLKFKKILREYHYDTRLENKGTLTRTIIDSLELPYTLGEQFIDFDNSIK